jgi:hypothetical protein
MGRPSNDRDSRRSRHVLHMARYEANSDDAGATAKEARVQQRLENAYIELLDMTERAGQWVQTVYPMINTMPPQSDPPLPTLAEQAHTDLRGAKSGQHAKPSPIRWQSNLDIATNDENPGACLAPSGELTYCLGS